MTYAFSADAAEPVSRRRRVCLAASTLAVALALPLSFVSAADAAKPTAPAHNQGPDISGVYWAATYSAKIQPVGGGDPPFTAAAMATYRKNMAAVAANTLDDSARKLCVPDGVPRALASPYPIELAQAPGQVYLFYELNHMIRVVDMDVPLPPEKDLATFPWYNGHSVGHWEGDTLVVQTAGFNEETFLDNSGAPHTDQLRTVERIRKISDKELEDVVTIHDPGVFTKDWSARFVYQARPDIRIVDYNCGEKHRDIFSVKGVVPR